MAVSFFGAGRLVGAKEVALVLYLQLELSFGLVTLCRGAEENGFSVVFNWK